MASENAFELKIITPDRIFYEGEIKMVEFNTVEGEVGIYKNHIPLTVIVKPGVLRINELDGVKEAALHSGFAEILPDKVTMMAEIIEWPEEIDEARAIKAKERAIDRMQQKTTDTDIARVETALQRAIARIDIVN